MTALGKSIIKNTIENFAFDYLNINLKLKDTNGYSYDDIICKYIDIIVEYIKHGCYFSEHETQVKFFELLRKIYHKNISEIINKKIKDLDGMIFKEARQYWPAEGYYIETYVNIMCNGEGCSEREDVWHETSPEIEGRAAVIFRL
jgi:hypothetical protein